MQIEVKEVTNGNLNNKVVWVSDIRHNGNPFEKLIRHTKPTKVIIRDNDNYLPKGKRVYYSESHFVVLDKNNKPTKKIIAPFDNTGYRSYTGIALKVFDNIEECEASYIKQKQLIIDDMNKALAELTVKMKNFISMD